MSRLAKPRKPSAGEEKMSEAPLYADRVRVYPRAVHGPARTFKWAVLVICLAVYYALPWIRWDRGPGRASQAVLLDLQNERFYFFNLEFWPQDIYYLTGALILGAVSLFLVTSLAGRVWCGYACPQTVWTDLFMWVEQRIEGDRNARMRRDQGPASFDKAWRKVAKHAVWLGVAFWTGGAWIMYYADAPTVTRAFWTGQASSAVYGFAFLFTATTYVLAGWAREQVCTYMCPWPRFQAAMLDEQSFIVTYQGWRGEPRGHGKRDAAAEKKLGDCVDCRACVNVCPTGIDIRDGVQLECINCGLCVDACNEIMVRTGQPKWLITWDTLARQKARAEGRREPIRLLRARTVIYVAALLLAGTVMGVALATRAHIELSVQHDRAPLFVKVRDGALRNGYTVKIVNKTHEAADFALSLQGLEAAGMAVAEENDARMPILTLTAEADSVGTFRVLVFGQPARLVDGSQDITFTLRNAATGEQTSYRSVFMGPGGRAGR
ncbi:cytochrome c oxidase accessory protein CcoG [Limobrevibacterium gyesilva]|uniref:Cytochrome c oxidase accessory protein CcoG n=1 Tax=Limobrevibacterium gyesilva TaxID=2991712 RepID=A0AA42CF31_9PROT|nr:cytochrome c oxidase accessory protein CcoG [Limobrevibacterium gyesilva]MCW3476763.1 cytochrome c oxidase accessory protein CcoG [Limobrevibacterium gyesilva]